MALFLSTVCIQDLSLKNEQAISVLTIYFNFLCDGL